MSDVPAELREWLVTQRTDSERQAARPELAGYGPGGAGQYAGNAEGYGQVIDHLDGHQGPLDLADLRGWVERELVTSSSQEGGSQLPGNADWRRTGISMAYGRTLYRLAIYDGQDATGTGAAEPARVFEGALRAHANRPGTAAGVAAAAGQDAGAAGPATPTASRAASATGRSRAARPGPAVPDRSA